MRRKREQQVISHMRRATIGLKCGQGVLKRVNSPGEGSSFTSFLMILPSLELVRDITVRGNRSMS